MNLVRHQVAELHHIDVTDHHFLIERIAGASVEKLGLATFLHPGEAILLPGILQVLANLLFLNSVEHRGRDFES